MPLESGKSKKAFSHNVAAEMNAGRPQKQALAIAYSKQKQHFDDGGEVQPDDSQEVASTPSSPSPNILDGLPADSSNQPSAPAPMNPVLADYLKNKQAMAQAQQQAGTNSFYTDLARAGSTLAAGMAHSDRPVDERPFDAMAANDQAPVTNVMNAQKSSLQDLQNQQALMSTQKQMGDNDPNSPQSIAARNLIKKLYPGKFEDSVLDTLSKADIGDTIMKPLELDEKIKEHADEIKQRNLDRAALYAGRKADKEESDHEKYVQHVEDNEKSWRSDPASTRFDAQLAAAQNGKALIDRYRGHEDDMPIQDIHALVSDRLKAITGVQPTEQEIKAQMPSTLIAKISNIGSWATGEPFPAGAGGFVKNIDQSFQEMEKTALAGLKHRQETVASSPRLTDDEKSRLVKIGVPEPAYKDNQVQYSPDVTKYAKDHNMDPSDAQRLKDMRQKGGSNSQGSEVANQPQNQNSGGATDSFAFGGVVPQPQGFRYVRMPITTHEPKLKPVAPLAPIKTPVEHVPVGDKSFTMPEKFSNGGMVYAQGGQVAGQPKFNHNDPRNDVVDAKLTPKEVVLPLSVTQAKDPAMAAYLFMKNLKR